MPRSRLALAVPCALLLLLGAACMAPMSSSQRLVDSARELNQSTRFGRMELATASVSTSAREAFISRRRTWGGELRIMDAELSGMRLDEDRKTAVVNVDVAWTRMSEGTLRSTRIEQVWKEQETGWRLTREKRVAGDIGLFGEVVEVARPEPGDVHYATRRLSPVITE